MTASDSAPQGVIASELMRAGSVLVLTHMRPDGDAVGSALGMAEFLRACGKRSNALFPEPLPRCYTAFARCAVTEIAPEALESYDAVLLLDCANPARIALGGIPPERLSERTLLNVDHHRGNLVTGAENCVDPEAAAASLLAFEIAGRTGRPIPGEAATLWYLGIVTDTGSFRFSNTTPRVFRTAAELLELGADQEAVTNAVFFSKPRGRQLFEADLAEHCIRFAADGRLAYAVLTPEIFERHHFDMRDGEGVVDLLREIEGTVISVLAHQRRDGEFKFSFRSKDAALPVGPFARAHGGGGHEMAAGATLRFPDAAAAERFILDHAPELAGGTKHGTL